MPRGDYYESYNDILSQLQAADAELKARENAKAEGYLQAAMQNPNLATPEYNGLGLDYSRALKQMLQTIVQDPLNADPSRARELILSNSLLRTEYGSTPAQLNDMALKLAQRTATGRFDPDIDDDPRLAVRQANREDNGLLIDSLKWAGDHISDTVLGGADALQKLITGEDLTEKNRLAHDVIEIDKALDQAPSELKTGAAKMSMVRDLKQQALNIQQQLRGNTNPDVYDNLTRQLNIINQRINTISDSLSDAEKAAYETGGAQYDAAKQERQFYKNRIDQLTPRYQMDVDSDTDAAQLKYEELVRNGKIDMFENPSYGLRYLWNQVVSPTAIARNAKVILPWVALGMFKPVFIAAGGAGLLGAATNADYEYMDQYFEEHGTLEGYNQALASIANSVGFIMDLAGGKLAGGIGKKWLSDWMFGKIDKIVKPALEASLATGSNAPLKAGFKALFNDIRLDKILNTAGRSLTNRAELNRLAKAEAGKTGYGVIGRTEDLLGKGLQKLATGERLAGRPLAHALKADASLAFENATATAARQVAAQNGMNAEAIAEAALEGLASGHLGMLEGAAMSPAARVLSGTSRRIANGPSSKYLRTEAEENTNRKSYEELTAQEKYQRATAEIESFDHIKNKVYEKELDKEGSKLSKKYKDELVYDKGTHELKPIAGKETSAEAQKALKTFKDKKEAVQGIIDKLGERKDYYSSLADSSLDQLIKEKGTEAYSDASIRKALGELDTDTVAQRMQEVKGISAKSAQLQAQMLTNQKASITHKDVGISEEAFNTSELMEADSTLLTDIASNAKAQDALAKADFKAFEQAVNDQITQNNNQITAEKAKPSPNAETIKDLEDTNARLKDLINQYTQDKWNNKKNVLIDETAPDDYIRKLDSSILPDKNKLGITDEALIGKSADDIRNALDNIRAKGINKAAFIDSLVAKNHKGQFIDTARNVLSDADAKALTDKLGNYYDKYSKELAENIENYNVHQKYKTFKSEKALTKELQKHNAEKAFEVKKTKNRKTNEDEYYAKALTPEKLSSDKALKQIKEFIQHPRLQISKKDEFNSILTSPRTKEIIENATHKTLRKRILDKVKEVKGSAKLSQFDADVFAKLERQDKNSVLKAIEDAYNASRSKEIMKAYEAIQSFEADSIRRYTGYSSGKQKRDAAFDMAHAALNTIKKRKLNAKEEERYKSVGGSTIDKMDEVQLGHFITALLNARGIYGNANSLLQTLSHTDAAANRAQMTAFVQNLNRSQRFDDQLAVLIEIVSRKVNSADFSQDYRDVLRCLTALRDVIASTGIAPVANGHDLWTGSLITASQRELFTNGNQEMGELYARLGDNAKELNQLLRTVQGVAYEAAMTNSQEIDDFTDDVILAGYMKGETLEAFNSMQQDLAIQFSDASMDRIANNNMIMDNIWRVASTWFVTDRDAGYDRYTDTLSRLLSTCSNKDVERFFRENSAIGAGRNPAAWANAFREASPALRRNIIRELMQNNTGLACILGETFPELQNTAQPAAAARQVRFIARDYLDRVNQLLDAIGLPDVDAHQAQRYYLSNALLRNAQTALILNPADSANLMRVSTTSYLLTCENPANIFNNLGGDFARIQGDPTFMQHAANMQGSQNGAIPWRPTYEELEAHLVNIGVTDRRHINYVANNYGHILYYLRASDTAVRNAVNSPDVNTRSRTIEVLTRAFHLRDTVIPRYRGRHRLPVVDQITANDFEYLRTLLRDNNDNGLTWQQLQQYLPEGSTVTNADFTQYIIDNNQFRTTLPTNLDAAKQQALATAMATYIIANPRIQTDLAGSRLNRQFAWNAPRDAAGHVTPSNSERLMDHAVAEGMLAEGDFRRGSLRSILDYSSGWERLLQESPDLANNEAIQLAKRMTDASKGQIKLGSDFISLIFGVDGDLGESYLSNVAAITVNFLPRFTGETSEDFLDKLAQKSQTLAAVFMNNPILDKTRTAKQLGAMIARKMGFRRNTVQYDNAVLASGAIALTMLKQQGLIEEIYINQTTGDIIPANAKGSEKGGTYPALRLTEKGERVRVNLTESITYDVGGQTHFLFDDILGLNFNNDMDLYAYDDLTEQDRYAEHFLEEWQHEHGAQLNATNSIQDYVTALGNITQGQVLHAGEYALVIMPPRGTTHPNVDWYVFNNTTKTDRTTVEDGRLLTLAELQRNGRFLNTEAALSIFSCMVDDHGNCIYTEADVQNVDNICGNPNERTNPNRLALIAAIGWEDPYEKSTSIYAGNIHNKNVNNFRQAIQTVNALRRIHTPSVPGGQLNIFNPPAGFTVPRQIRLRFDEINTVNNRLFVESLVANYREQKLIRGLFDNYEDQDMTFTLNDSNPANNQIQGSDIATTFFHSLGMDGDKIPSEDAATEGFINLLRDAEFQHLVHATAQLSANARRHNRALNAHDISEIIREVQRFNEHNAHRDNPLTYTVTKVAKHANAQEPIELMAKLNASQVAAFLNFCTQVTIQVGTNSVYLDDYGLDNFANDIEEQHMLNIEHWSMRCEIDGLTNGPSVKANAVGLKENRDPFSKVLLGSVGINSRFVNVFEAQLNGLLDIYLVSGEFGRAEMAEDIIGKFIADRGKNDTILPYLSALFGKDAVPTDYMEVLGNIFDRNMLKYPVMYTNYGAGKAGIILNIMVLFDKQFSTLAAHPRRNEAALRAWFTNLQKMANQDSYTFTYLPRNARHAQYIKVNKNGDVIEGGEAYGFSGTNIFSNHDLMAQITFEHARNEGAKVQLNRILGDLYQAMADNLDALNTPYKKVTESAQTMAEVFNAVVQNLVTKALPDVHDTSKQGMSQTEYIRLVHSITETTLQHINNIIHIGRDTNGSELNTIRESVTDSVMQALSIYVVTKDGRYYSRVKQVLGARESLGAGNVPMMIHSYDSYIMHQFLNIMLNQYDRTITSIHDAIIARPDEVNYSYLMNREHYLSGPTQLGTFACVVRNLNMAKNALSSLGLDKDIESRLSFKLQAAQNDMFSETLALMQQNLRWLEEQRELPRNRRMPDNQYSYRARSAYRPSDDDLDLIIDHLRQSMRELIDVESALPLAKEAIVNAILTSNRLTAAERDALLTRENQLSNAVAAGAHTVTELVHRVNSILQRSNPHFHINLDNILQQIRHNPANARMQQVVAALSNTGRYHVRSPEAITPEQYNRAIQILRDHPSIQSFTEAVYAAKNYYTKHVFFTGRNSDTEIQRRLTANLLRWINSGKPLTSWGVYELLRQTTGLHKLDQENSADFETISIAINNQHNVIPDVTTFNTTQDFTLHYSDNIDFHAVLEKLRRTGTYVSLGMKQGTKDLGALIEYWYQQSVVKHMRETYRGYKGQVVFTLRSDFELLELRALQELKNTDAAFKDITIVVTPGITNITGVNPELFFFQELCGRSKAVNKQFIYRSAPDRSKNKDLLTIGLNTEVTESSFTNDNTVMTEPHIYVSNPDRNGKRYITVNEFYTLTKSHCKEIQRMDEHGDDSVTQAQTLTAFDLQTSGVRGNSDITYDFTDTVNLSEEEAIEHVNQGDFTAYNINSDNAVDGSIEENLYGDDASAVLINTTSDGEILGAKVRHAYRNAKGLPYFNEAYEKFITLLNRRQENYRDHKLSNFTAVMMPIKVSVRTRTGKSKVFIFNPALQTAITREELLNSFAEKGNADTFRDQVLADSPLYNMLAYKYKSSRGGIAEIRHFILTHTAGSPSDVIQIPAKFIDDAYKEDLNTSNEMRYKSALGLKKVLEDVAKAGYNAVLIPYDNTKIYTEETPKILPDIANLQYGFLTLADRNSAYDSQLSHGYAQHEDGIINNIKDYLLSGIRASNRQHPESAQSVTDAVETPEVAHVTGYRGRVDTAVLGTLQGYFKDGNDIVSTIEDAISDDSNRGVNTDLINNLLPVFRTLNTMIGYYLNDRDVTESFSLVARKNQTLEYDVVSIGSKLTGTRSKAEVISHETIHTVLRHMGMNTRLVRESQEIYDFIQRNLKITDFTDGDTLENRAIMDAVFNEKTANNIEECICYYLTNEAFHEAVNRMAVRQQNKKITNKIYSVIHRILDKIIAFFTGVSSVNDMDIPNAMYHIFQECSVLNNKYWENKEYLKELGREDLSNPLDFDMNVAVKAGSSATEKFLQSVSGQKLLGAAMVIHDQSYVDEIADSIREFCDVEAGFVNDIMASLQGVSNNQLPYLKLRLEGKKRIDKMREDASAMINDLVNTTLKNTPAKVKNKLVTHFMRPDISCILKYNELDQAYSYVTDKKARAKRISELEASIKTDSWYNYYVNCAQGLAAYLVTGFNPTGLSYVNAYEIIAKAGSSHQQSVQDNGKLQNTIDELISLYALNLLELKTPDFYKQIDKETFRKLSDIHNSIKDAENIDIDNNKFAKLHIPKGELHAARQLHDYRIINAEEYKAYKWAGYTKVSDAELDPFTKAHFPNNKYIMVKALFKPVVPIEAGCSILTDVFKGRLKGGITVDDITDENFREGTGFKELQNYINQRVTNLNKPNPALLTTPTSGNLVLHFNSLNRLSGAKFEINPMESLKQTNSNVRIGSAMGSLYGSLLERSHATAENEKVGQAIIDIYENADDQENFEWISETSENEEYRDYYDSVPKAIKDILTKKYKDKGIPIRKSALNTFFGYKHLSANDTKKFIENERKAQANIDGLASNFKVAVRNLFYNKYVGYGEALARYLAKVGKENILIKGITTSWFNVVSNYILLGLNGLRPDKALAYEIDGINQFLQIRDYNEKLKTLNQKKIMHTYNDIDARTEKGIKDAMHKLPMYPLYAKGLVGDTLAEDLTESDRFVMNAIDKYTSKGLINTLLHNAVLDPQGILYNILSDFASLGDVAGKYALYRYNREKGMDEEEAQRRSLNAFIDYSNPLPKSLQLLDDIAVLPFMKYSVGIQNVIADTLVRHPERSLAWLFANGTFDITNDVFDSLLGLGTLANKLQVPSKMFIDSLKTLPSVRLYDALT